MNGAAKSFITLATMILLLAFLMGASQAAPLAGSSEVQVAAGAFHAQGSDTGNFNADVSYGYYLTPGWEIGFRQALSYDFNQHERDFWVATTTPFIDYNFHVSDILIPYLGIQGGAAWNDQHATGTFGPNAGLKLFFTKQTFLNIGYRYEWFFNSFKAAIHHRTEGNHVGNIGIGFDWGGS